MHIEIFETTAISKTPQFFVILELLGRSIYIETTTLGAARDLALTLRRTCALKGV